MSSTKDPTASPPEAGGPAALRARLMPDYGHAAAAYWLALVVAGTVVLALAVHEVASFDREALVQVLIGTTAAALVGLFPVRLPGSKHAIAAGDVFVFLLLLLHGPAAAVIGAAAEAALSSWRASKRLTSWLASPAAAAIAIYVSGALLYRVLAAAGGIGKASDGLLLTLVMLFAALYFLIVSALLTAVVYLKRGQRPTATEWLGNFGWVALSYAAAASVAGLLYLTGQTFGVPTLLITAPIIAMFLATLHYYFGQQEANAQAARERLEAAEREAAQAARYLRELQSSERRFHSAFTHASIGMVLAGADGRVLQVNRALCVLLGYDEPDLVGRQLGEFVAEEDRHRFDDSMARIGEDELRSFTLELRWPHRHGNEVWTSVAGSFFDGVAGSPLLIFQLQDITARRRAEDRLHHIAYHDPLTNLANRARFNDCLQLAIDRNRAGAEHHYAVLFLDFDRFKVVNDSLGHRAGDEFLVKAADRIREHVRPADVVARLGGDEFAILTEGIELARDAVALAERLQRVLRIPVLVGRNEITTSASIGITFSGFGYTRPDEVLRDADIAMYKAKASGKAQYALFDASLHADVATQLVLESELRRAIDSDQLSLEYQPLYELQSGRLLGFEALARWSHPLRGMVPPSVFIPLAEEAGLIGALTQHLLERACAQLAAWHKAHPAAIEVRVHLNISGADLCAAGFAYGAMRTLAAWGLQPKHLVLEISESVLMERLDAALPALEDLARFGIGVSVDDFGTGYSSLAYLSALPIASLKIDRSFVGRLQAGEQTSEIVRAVIMLGAALGKKVIAEGIETSAQMSRLRELGCEIGQGFHMSRPIGAGQADLLLTVYKDLPPRAELPRPMLACSSGMTIE